MAMIKCPECGRENVSSTAKSCPGCSYNIKAYYEAEQQKEVVSNTAAPTNKINVKTIIGVAVACIVIFCIYYFCTRCTFDSCTEKRTENSKYCAYHSLSYTYGSSFLWKTEFIISEFNGNTFYMTSVRTLPKGCLQMVLSV